MINTIFHPANQRGHANHGWLNAHHSFSFASYFDRHKMNFGALRVLNDDEVAPGMGFSTHPHDNMEIITIPLEGDISHRDNMGNEATINAGYIQVMSAGTGVQHSEFNPNKDKFLKLLQIWIMPNEQNVTPRYGDLKLPETTDNNWLKLVSPAQQFKEGDSGTWIHQNAWLHIGNFDTDKSISYLLNDVANGVYVFVIEGSVDIENQSLAKRDALGIWNTNSFEIKTTQASKILLIEVPM
jgi:quercetin 2,3-dioxygenase